MGEIFVPADMTQWFEKPYLPISEPAHCLGKIRNNNKKQDTHASSIVLQVTDVEVRCYCKRWSYYSIFINSMCRNAIVPRASKSGLFLYAKWDSSDCGVIAMRHLHYDNEAGEFIYVGVCYIGGQPLCLLGNKNW